MFSTRALTTLTMPLPRETGLNRKHLHYRNIVPSIVTGLKNTTDPYNNVDQWKIPENNNTYNPVQLCVFYDCCQLCDLHQTST